MYVLVLQYRVEDIKMEMMTIDRLFLLDTQKFILIFFPALWAKTL